MRNKRQKCKHFSYNFLGKNRKGFMKILEAFTAIMLITLILLIILNKNAEETDVSQLIYDSQYSILKQIQLNRSMRSEILDVAIPVEHDDVNFPNDVKNKIEADTPVSLICKGKLCVLNDDCPLSNAEEDKSVYAQTAVISADLDTYSPRKLKLFCWQK